MVGEDHGGALVTVVENLRFHAVEAKADGDLHRLCGGLQNVLQMFLDQLLNGQGWDIAGAANGHRNAPDTTAIGVKSLVDQLSDVAENGVVCGIGHHILVHNELPRVLEIQDLLHICCRHAIDLTVFDNVLRLREGSRHAFQNSLIVDICLHIGAGEVNIQYDPVGQL